MSFHGKYVIILYKNSMKRPAAYPAGYAAALYRGHGYMGEINRGDMLELARRMTLKRNCFDRIAGAYLDEEGSCRWCKIGSYREGHSYGYRN